MHIPFQFGLPQVFLLIIALVGLWLFIMAALELIRVPQGRFRRRFRWGRGLSGILLLVVAISLLWLTFLVQTYLGLTGEIKVAQIKAITLTNAPHQMSVELILYDDQGRITSDNTYLVSGDEWMLQGDIVKFSTWANVIGLHSGYKLTRLEGRYDDINKERSSPHFAIDLNGGDDNFFKAAMTHQSWFSWFADALYGNAVFQGQGKFNIFATQDALIARPTS